MGFGGEHWYAMVPTASSGAVERVSYVPKAGPTAEKIVHAAWAPLANAIRPAARAARRWSIGGMLPGTRVDATSASGLFAPRRFLASTLLPGTLAADFTCRKATVDVDQM